jgi:hypothetical protein
MKFCYTALAFSATLLISNNAWGCLSDVPPVTVEDLQYPPAKMIAFSGLITKVTIPQPLGAKPHGGFQLRLKVVQVFQGVQLGNSITVLYGNCHNLPGKKGDKINVLALPNQKGGWYAPQFWQRRAFLPEGRIPIGRRQSSPTQA